MYHDDVDRGNLEDKPLFHDDVTSACISQLLEKLDVIFYIIDHSRGMDSIEFFGNLI